MSSSRTVIDISSSSSSDDDDDDMDVVDTFDLNLFSAAAVEMARDPQDPDFLQPANQRVLRDIEALWSVLPSTERPARFAPLLLRILRARTETARVNVIEAAWRARPSNEIGAPRPFTRAECFRFVRGLAYLTSSIAAGKVHGDVFDIRSRLSTYAVVSPQAVTRLLDGHEWVDDEAVDAFGALLEAYLDRDGTRIVYIPTFVWKERPPYGYIRRFLGAKQGDFLRSSRFLFAPITRQSHWVFVAFNLVTGECFFYNSYSATWKLFRDDAVQATFKVLVECLHEQVPAVKLDAEPVRVDLYPRQRDSTSCALYVIHGMECLASAVHEVQFQQRTWDDKTPLLRLHVFICLVDRQWRPLRTSLTDNNNDDDDASDDLMDDDAPVPRFDACSGCGAGGENLRICVPWHLAFCSSACQSKHAKTHRLHY